MLWKESGYPATECWLKWAFCPGLLLYPHVRVCGFLTLHDFSARLSTVPESYIVWRKVIDLEEKMSLVQTCLKKKREVHLRQAISQKTQYEEAPGITCQRPTTTTLRQRWIRLRVGEKKRKERGGRVRKKAKTSSTLAGHVSNQNVIHLKPFNWLKYLEPVLTNAFHASLRAAQGQNQRDYIYPLSSASPYIFTPLSPFSPSSSSSPRRQPGSFTLLLFFFMTLSAI